jgi:hypothetical protein
MQELFHDCPPLLSLRIALMPFLSGERVGMIVNELITSLPELDLTVVDWNEDADARIISRSMSLQNEAFHKLWVDDYVLAMSIKHPLCHTVTFHVSVLCPLKVSDFSGSPSVETRRYNQNRDFRFLQY